MYRYNISILRDCPAPIKSVNSKVNNDFVVWQVHNGAHLIIIDPEISLLGPQVPLYNCPTFETYEQLKMDRTKSKWHLKSETFTESMNWHQQQCQCHFHNYSSCCNVGKQFRLVWLEKSSCSPLRSLHLCFITHIMANTGYSQLPARICTHSAQREHTKANHAFSNLNRVILDCWKLLQRDSPQIPWEVPEKISKKKNKKKTTNSQLCWTIVPNSMWIFGGMIKRFNINCKAFIFIYNVYHVIII